MRLIAALTLAGVATLTAGTPSQARVHAPIYCWALDSELPVACDAEEEAGVRPLASEAGIEMRRWRRGV